MLRDFRAMRQLTVGDTVWVLHCAGVRWLPAVIEKIHTLPHLSNSELKVSNESQHNKNVKAFDAAIRGFLPADTRTNPFPCYHYDVWYPLNDKELFRSRMATTSKQLLTLPSQVEGAMLKPKPFVDEDYVCSYAFDLLDGQALGIVELETLVGSLQSAALQEIVDTSLVLTVLVRASPPQIEERLASLVSNITSTVISRNGRKVIRKQKKIRQPQLRMPCLLSVLVDTFSGDSDEIDNTNANTNTNTNSDGNNVEDVALSQRDFFLTSGGGDRSAGSVGDLSGRSASQRSARSNGRAVAVEGGMRALAVEPLVSLGCISKSDFLEFCKAVFVACKYDAERLKPMFIVQ
jgi:hypothetical protein